MDLQKKQTLDIVHNLAKALKDVETFDHTKKQAVSAHLGQIEECILDDKIPDKEQFDELFKAIGTQESIMAHATQLAQSFGYLPSL